MDIESERLAFRLWEPRDFDQYAAFYADEESARYVGGPCDRAQAWRRMASELGHWMLLGYGPWALEEKATGDLVGSCGLWQPEGWPELEVGYWLLANKQGRGYATEAAERTRAFAYEELGVTTLVSYIDPANDASKRVVERIGARFEKTIELGKFLTHEVFRHPGPDAL